MAHNPYTEQEDFASQNGFHSDRSTVTPKISIDKSRHHGQTHHQEEAQLLRHSGRPGRYFLEGLLSSIGCIGDSVAFLSLGWLVSCSAWVCVVLCCGVVWCSVV
jgi:hypothetical protein